MFRFSYIVKQILKHSLIYLFTIIVAVAFLSIPFIAGGLDLYILSFFYGLIIAFAFTIIPYLTFILLFRMKKKLFNKSNYSLLGGVTPIFADIFLLYSSVGAATLFVIATLSLVGVFCGSVYYDLDSRYEIKS